MEKPIVEADGIDCRVMLMQDRVRIIRKGLVARALDSDIEEIPYWKVTSLKFKSRFNGGYIRFMMAEQEEKQDWPYPRAQQVKFSVNQREQFEAIRQIVESRIGRRQEHQINRSILSSGRQGNVLQFDESAGGLERDESATFIVPEGEDERIRFECGEFQTPISTKRIDFFFYYARLQNFEPVHVAAHNGKEWWWFRGGFYKVEFEEGRPSADLAADIGVDDWPDKTSLALDPHADSQGFSRDEVAEGVFEMEGKAETALEVAGRLDTAHTVTVQAVQASNLYKLLASQDTSRDLGLQRDDSARVFVDKSWWRTQVCMESNLHQPRQVLVEDDTMFRLIPELQNNHPILIDKKTGRGRLWRSEVVAEWWCFKGDIYLAKREKGYQSEALSLLKETVSHIPHRGKSEAWIPKWTLGNEFEDLYEEGYAPEEIVRLILALEGKQESLEEMFDRVRTAKDVLDENRNFRSDFQLPWDVNRDWSKHDEVQEYLEERRLEGKEGLREEQAGGYWFNFKEWDRKRRRDFWSRMTERDDDNSSATARTQGVSSKPKREGIPKSVKMYVWQRDQGRCVECGSNEKLEYDHIIPLAKGGSNTDRNIQLLCERCNRSKGTSIS